MDYKLIRQRWVIENGQEVLKILEEEYNTLEDALAAIHGNTPDDRVKIFYLDQLIKIVEAEIKFVEQHLS